MCLPPGSNWESFFFVLDERRYHLQWLKALSFSPHNSTDVFTLNLFNPVKHSMSH